MYTVTYLWEKVWLFLLDILQPFQEEAHFSECQEARNIGLHHLHSHLAHMHHLIYRRVHGTLLTIATTQLTTLTLQILGYVVASLFALVT